MSFLEVSDDAEDEDTVVLLDKSDLDHLADIGLTSRRTRASSDDFHAIPLTSFHSNARNMDVQIIEDEAEATNTPSEPLPRSSGSSTLSPIRSLVRSLTPKKRPKPILIKAGFQRVAPNGEEQSDLRVTFQLPQRSPTRTAFSAVTDAVGAASTGAAATGSAHVTEWLRKMKRCCDHPLIPIAGFLSLVGGMSFGYDMGIIAGVLQPLREQFRLTCVQEQVLVGCLIGGALLVSFCGGPWIDKCGRRRSILISCFVFLFGTGLSAIAPNLDTLAAGRLLQGFGMSMSTIAECIYISEIAPKEKRGLMVGLNELGITLGFVLAFLVGYLLHDVHNSWRIMMAVGAAPAAIQLLGTFFLLPPSPREKMMNKCDKEAIVILEHLRNNRNEALNEFASIRHSLVIEESYGTLALFRSADNMLFRLLVGFSLVFLQQISGQPNVLYYATVVFEQVGFTTRQSSLATLGLGVVKVIATVVALSITDRKGRRFFLILGCLMMAASIAVVGISTLASPPLLQKPCDRPSVNLTFYTSTQHSATVPASTPADVAHHTVLSENSTLLHTQPGVHVAQLVVDFLALMTYVVGYSISFGPMTWLVLSELYPAGVKGRAMSFANVVNWSVGLVVTLTFLQTMTALTPGGTFLGFSVINLFSALYIFLVVPETKGKSLEKVSYELRTIRPKQRFDENLQLLCPCLRSRLNRPGMNHDYSRVDRDALI